MDGDDPRRVAAALAAAARRAEVTATLKVRDIAEVTSGAVQRFDSRFKTGKSILEKLERFRAPESPHYRSGRFNDALRYTIVYDEADYWAAANQVACELSVDGWSVPVRPTRWRRTGYKGLNPDGPRSRRIRVRSAVAYPGEFGCRGSHARPV